MRSTSLVANHLFQVRPEDERTLLNEERATEFHHMAAQLLFILLRASKDIKMLKNFSKTPRRG